MRSTNFLIYSKQRNKECSRLQNEYMFRDFSEDAPQQALVDFTRNQYFPSKKHTTRGKPTELQPKIIRSFITNDDEKNKFSEEQRALCHLLEARGGQAMSSDLALYTTNSLDLSHQDQPYISAGTLELTSYTRGPKNNSLCRYDIQLHYATAVGNEFKVLNSETGKLESIDSDNLEKLNNAITAIQATLLASREFEALQRNIRQKSDLLIIAKLLEEAIENKLHYRPISFAVSTRKLTPFNKHKGYFDLPLGLFSCTTTDSDGKTNIDQNNLPDLPTVVNKQGKRQRVAGVIIEQTDFVVGSNTTDVKIKESLIQENHCQLSQQESVDHAMRRRNLDDRFNSTPWINADKERHSRPKHEFKLNSQPEVPEPSWLDILNEFKKTIEKLINDAVNSLTSKNSNSGNRPN